MSTLCPIEPVHLRFVEYIIGGTCILAGFVYADLENTTMGRHHVTFSLTLLTLECIGFSNYLNDDI